MRLEAHALEVALGAFHLGPLDLCVESGTVLGIVGPNGSGKTTLLRALSGAVRPTAGAVSLVGRPLDTWAPRDRARALAVVSQKTELRFPFTVGEVVLLGRTPHHAGFGWGRFGFETADDRTVAQAALAETGTEHLADRWFVTLSGGEQQRVSIARALCQDPRVLLLDEPTANLDLKFQVRVLDLLRARAAQGVAVVIVLHDLNLAASWCDHVVVMDGGVPRLAGRPADVLDADALSGVFGVPVRVVTDGDRRWFAVGPT